MLYFTDRQMWLRWEISLFDLFVLFLQEDVDTCTYSVYRLAILAKFFEKNVIRIPSNIHLTLKPEAYVSFM